MTTTSDQQQQLTTEIVELPLPLEFFPNTTNEWPEYKRNVLGLVYLDDFDGIKINDNNDNNNEKIEIPSHGTIDPNEQPQYQCIKCGKIQTSNESSSNDLHRMKCLRCYNKAFNKIRPTKWVKFNAY